MAKTDARMDLRFLGHATQVHPGREAGPKTCQLGGSRVLCTRDAFARQLRPGCSIVLCTCVSHIGTKARAMVSTNEGCLAVHHPVATLIRCLGLVWARGLGLTEATDQLGYPDCVHCFRVKQGRKHRPCQSAPPTMRFQ